MKRVALAAAIAAMLASFSPVALGAIKAEPKAEPISELRPPRSELPAPLIENTQHVWVLGSLAGAMVLVLIFMPRRKPPVPPPDPFAVAQRELDSLRADAAKATPVTVSAVVRRFAMDAFGLAGGGLTSEEVVSGLVTRRSCPVELTNATWHFLSECDRVKFAPHEQPPDAPTLVASAATIIGELEAARAKAARTL
jgi:hypothetical protein